MMGKNTAIRLMNPKLWDSLPHEICLTVFSEVQYEVKMVNFTRELLFFSRLSVGDFLNILLLQQLVLYCFAYGFLQLD